MKNWLKRISSFDISPASVPLLLLVVGVLAYGIILPQLGFYWDDFPISWIRYQLGPEAMRRYFSNNRPFLGILYQVTTRILPYQPIVWQLLALFWRWVSGVLAWAIARQLWPKRPHFTVGISLFFLLYPGFNQQWVSFIYSHYFIVLSLFLFSLLCMLWSLRPPRWLPSTWLLTALGMLCSVLNLWMMEYFFVLELFRPFLLLFVLREQIPDLRMRLRRLILFWSPYLAVFLAAVSYRVFVFNNQVYPTSLLSKLRAEPLTTTVTLIQTIMTSLWTVSAAAWAQVFHLLSPTVSGPRTTTVYVALVLVSFAVVIVYLLRSRQEEIASETERRKEALWAVELGLIAMFLAGWPFWLIDLPPALGFPANRFTLPFILGTSLLLAGLIELIPHRITRFALVVLLVSLAVGRQFQWANEYRRDWNTQKNLFWQMSWRIPRLQPDTLVILNEGAFNYYADNSLSAPLNWIYQPENRSDHIGYMLFYPTSRLGGGLPGLEEGLPVQHNFLAGRFEGNTSQAVVIFYSPPSCLRVLDPELDTDNHLIPDQSLLRQAATLSKKELILTDSVARMPPIFNPEPPHQWCYYFEKADLARQGGDWVQVVNLGEKAFKLDDYPNDPVERFVFIEGYAQTQDWGRAFQLSKTSFRVSPAYVGPLLCRLWERIEQTAPDSSEKSEALQQAFTEFHCSS